MREQLVEAIVGHINGSVPSRKGNVVFVTGEAGIGKTTLLNHCRRVLAESQPTPLVAAVECSTPLAGQGVGEAEALKPFADVLAKLLERTAAEADRGFKFDLKKFMIDTAPSWMMMIPVIGTPIGAALDIMSSGYDQFFLHKKMQENDQHRDQDQIFRQYINVLRTIAQKAAVVLVLDDMHWADTSSANLLFAASRELVDVPITFIVAYRDIDVRQSGHALETVRNELHRYELAVDVSVAPIASADVRTLMTERYTRYAPNVAFEDWLIEKTGGVPLLITQIIRTLEEDGLVDANTGLVDPGVRTARLPSTITAVVQERLRRLTDDERDLLRYASVEGVTFTSMFLARATGMPMLKVLQTLRRIEEHHHLIICEGKRAVYESETTSFQFTHALLQDVLYGSLTQEERELLHEECIGLLVGEEAIAHQKGRRSSSTILRLAVHLATASRFAEASERLMDAAAETWASGAAPETTLLLKRVRWCNRKASLRGQPVHQLVIRCAKLAARLHMQAAAYGKALMDAHAAHQEAERIHDAVQQAECLGIMATIHGLNGRYAEAESLAERALALSSDTSVAAIAAWRIRGNIAFRMGRLDDAEQAHQKAMSLAMRANNAMEYSTALMNLGAIAVQQGDVAKALAKHEQALELAIAEQDVHGMRNAQYLIGVDYLKMDMGTKARSPLEEALHMARRHGDIRLEARTSQALAQAFIVLGAYQEARRLATEAVAIAERIGDVAANVRARATLGDVQLLSHDRIEAVATYAQVMELCSRHGLRRMRDTIFRNVCYRLISVAGTNEGRVQALLLADADGNGHAHDVATITVLVQAADTENERTDDSLTHHAQTIEDGGQWLDHIKQLIAGLQGKPIPVAGLYH
ncbi:MAG: tetratricopeptide repeat protein [Candidatus Kapabacteria bacterium]|nr:tetratricopeptide repeat protein [Candidatus Kapabacteria bacterium]